MITMTKVLARSAWLAWALLTASLAGLGWMMLDTAAPFVMLDYTAESVRPGAVLRVDVQVRRDLSRKCSVTFSRHMFDSAGTRVDLVGSTQMTAKALEGLEKHSPGQLRMAVPIPPYVSIGRAHLVTPLAYVCNAWHSVRPIETTMVIDFEVVP